MRFSRVSQIALFVLVCAAIPAALPAAETCRGLTATMVGTPGNDQLRGTEGNDVVVGLGGNDTIRGEGDDTIDGGSGKNNTLHGDEGWDICTNGKPHKCEAEAGDRAPVANAGPDQTARPGDMVTLDGSASSDADGDPITFLWSFESVPAGSSPAISDPWARADVQCVRAGRVRREAHRQRWRYRQRARQSHGYHDEFAADCERRPRPGRPGRLTGHARRQRVARSGRLADHVSLVICRARAGQYGNAFRSDGGDADVHSRSGGHLHPSTGGQRRFAGQRERRGQCRHHQLAARGTCGSGPDAVRRTNRPTRRQRLERYRFRHAELPPK